MQVCFAQSWVSLDINTLITTSLRVPVVQGIGPCQTYLHKVGVSHIFVNVSHVFWLFSHDHIWD